jgi:MFS family permease
MSTSTPSPGPPPPPPPTVAWPSAAGPSAPPGDASRSLDPHADLPSRAAGGSRWRAVILAIAIAFAFADASIVVLGLPSIYGELQTTIVQASWVITIYALVVTIVALLIGPLAARLRPASVALVGLVGFAAGSALSGVAGSIGLLYAGRALQGFGAALALVASLPVLVHLTGSVSRGRHWWVTAAVSGASVGPALGGLLTQVFAWRAIFFVQVPVAVVAVIAVAAPSVRRGAVDLPGRVQPRALVANAGEVVTFGALVGALFLGVLLLVVVWGYDPIVGAVVVSALPAASFAVRPLAARVSPAVSGAAGAVVLAGGLAGLAFLPRVSGALAAVAFALCGAGMGLALSVLGPASLPEASGLVGAGSRAVAARHAGLMLGLLLIAPLLGNNLEARANDSALAGTRSLLEAQLPLRQKIPVAWALRKEIQQTPDGEVPDVDGVFAAQGAGDNPSLASARDGLVGTIEAILTRAFRSSFLIAAALALLALVPLLALTLGRSAAAAGAAARVPPRSCTAGLVIAGLVAVGAIAFVTLEWRGGAQDFGRYEAADPCAAGPDTYPGKGLDGTVQRIALGGLNGAACDLGTSREELILSLDPKSGIGDIAWDRDTAAKAIQSGTSRAIDDAVDRGTLPSWAGRALRFVVERAPIQWLLDKLPI